MYQLVVLIVMLMVAPALGSLDEKVDGLFGRWTVNTPGLVIAASEQGRVVFDRAFGSADLRFHIAMQPNFRFNVGSVAKQFTAYAIYDLEAKGQLTVADPVGKYVPGLSTLVGSVTIRDLLEHTSGLRDYFALAQISGISLEDALDTATIIRFANAQRDTDFPPGSDYEYSNTNYVLLAEVVRRVTGAPLGAYLERNVFRPLGMRDTAVVTTHGLPIVGLVTSYWPSDGGAYIERHALLDVQGDGNLITSASDLLRWDDNLDTMRLGKPIIERMLERGRLPGSRPAQTRYVNGLVADTLDGVQRITTDGGIAGFRAETMTFPSARISVVMLSNLVSLFPEKELESIAETLLGTSGPPVAPESSPASQAEAAALRVDGVAYQGRYYSAEVDTSLWVCPIAGSLEIRQLRGATLTLQPIAQDRFKSEMWWLTSADFVRRNGAVALMLVSGRSAHRIRFARMSSSCPNDPGA